MHYRVPVYERLASDEYHVSVYYGKERCTVPSVRKCQYFKLRSLELGFSFGFKNYEMPFYPQAVIYILAKRPHVVIMEGATNLINNIFLFAASKLASSKIIWWDAGRRKGSTPNILRRLADPLINFLMRHTDACLAYSSLAKDYMINVGVPDNKVTVAYNTIDTDLLDKKIPANRDIAGQLFGSLHLTYGKVLIYVGGLEKRKRVEDLISAFELLFQNDQSLTLLVIGDGPHKTELEKLAEQKHLSRILFLGKKIEDVGAYLMMSTVFVLPNEGGLGIVEAMAHSVPVVVTSADGTELDLVEDGVNGFLVQEGNIEHLASAISEIIYDRKKQERFAIAARNKINSKFLIKDFTAAILKTIATAS